MEKRKIYGYHGTTQDKADVIVRAQTFLDSSKDNEWLGAGVYFFAYLGHAKWWVAAKRYRGTETSILKSCLEYTDEQLLDLDDPEQLKKVNEVVGEAVRIANESGLTTPSVNLKEVSESQKWNFVCNTFRSICPEIGITMYTFMTKSYFDTIGYRQTQRQICVSDHSIIGKTEVV